MGTPQSLCDHAQISCIWEVTARKLGNVHRLADFKNTTLLDFLLSSIAVGNACRGATRVGEFVYQAVEATQRLVGQNTNLGICLILAPLVTLPQGCQLGDHLRSLTLQDARDVYRAIRLANPGGLGEAPEQDVHAEPTVTLLEAMRLAAERDQIARQYANDYADIEALGLPALKRGFARHGRVEPAIIECQLAWLATFPDSLIVRKCGRDRAETIRRRAAEILERGGLETAEGRREAIRLDRHLRSEGNQLNPGTTADLVTACLFMALQEAAILPSAPFHWDCPEWMETTIPGGNRVGDTVISQTTEAGPMRNTPGHASP